MKILYILIIALLLLSQIETREPQNENKKPSENSLLDSFSEDQMLQSHGSFIGSFISTTVSEIGDKTFIMTAILSSKYNRFWVFIGSVGSMLIMTLISCLLGSLTEYFVPLIYIKFISSALFLIFGLKMLYEVYTDTVDDEDDEAEEEVEELEKRLSQIVKKPKTETDQNEGSKQNSSSDQQQSTEANSQVNEKKKKKKQIKGIAAPGYVIAMQTFVSNFFGEWGDKSQISTIAISASYDFLFVFLGTVIGQIFCILLALIGGQVLAKQFSEKTMALLGGILFVIFSFITFYTTLNK
ncbi:hypothetical protein ABPG74_015616 [Tetrahymena malaccensis]